MTVQTVFDNYTAPLQVDGQNYELGLWGELSPRLVYLILYNLDTAGKPDYDRFTQFG